MKNKADTEQQQVVGQQRRAYEPPVVSEAKLTTLVKGISGPYSDGANQPHFI